MADNKIKKFWKKNNEVIISTAFWGGVAGVYVGVVAACIKYANNNTVDTINSVVEDGEKISTFIARNGKTVLTITEPVKP